MRKILIILILLLITGNSQAQTTGTGISQIIPPSPEMSALFRYLEFSVNHASGIPSIDIPIYEIKHGPITLPITISYDASGRKAAEYISSVGMGWMLNTGCAISRTIKGKDDFLYGPVKVERTAEQIKRDKSNPLNYDVSLRKRDYAYLQEAIEDLNPYIDNIYGVRGAAIFNLEHDIFAYNIPGHMGYYTLYDGALDNSPVSIRRDYPNTTWSIINETGIKFNFVPSEQTGLKMSLTGWSIDEIQSPNSKHKIKFKYLPKESVYIQGKNQTENIFLLSVAGSTGEDSPGRTTCTSSLRSTNDISNQYSRTKIDEIDFETGKLKFEYDNEKKYITKITILDPNKKEIKRCHFEYSQFEGKLYLLNRIIWKDVNGKIVKQYSFDYNLDYNHSVAGKDYWGFRNNSNFEAYPFARFMQQSCEGFSPEFFGSDGREPDYMVGIGVLRKITYPTGGNTSFYYESNKYYDKADNKIKTGPGIRVYEIISDDGKGGTISKTYKYGDNENGYGEFKFPPSAFNGNLYSAATTYFVNNCPPGGPKCSSNSPDPCCDNYVHTTSQTMIFSSDYTKENAFLARLPVFYREVAEYVNYSDKNNSIKTVYDYQDKYESMNIPSVSPFPSVPNYIYPLVPPHTTGVINNLRSTSGLEYYPDYHSRYLDYFWKKNVIRSKFEYVNDGKGNYIPVKEIHFTYKDTPLDTLNCIYVERTSNLMNYTTRPYLPIAELEANISIYSNFSFFDFRDYFLIKGKSELVKTKEVLFFGKDKVVSETSYEYHPNGLLYKSTKMGSTGKVFSEEIKYPENFASGNNIYSKMVGVGQIGLPVLKTNYINNVFASSARIEYKDWGNNLFSPATFYFKEQTNQEEPRLNYHNYDSYGNPLYISKDNAERAIYLWGYNYQYPIAEIKNATYDEVVAVLGVTPESIAAKAVPSESDFTAVNNLRKVPSLKNAMISTYTYQPLVGITSSTDPRGITTHYEYHSFGQLSKIYIKDNNGVEQVIERYDYHYKNQ